jgi:hypothetical protein
MISGGVKTKGQNSIANLEEAGRGSNNSGNGQKQLTALEIIRNKIQEKQTNFLDSETHSYELDQDSEALPPRGFKMAQTKNDSKIDFLNFLKKA